MIQDQVLFIDGEAIVIDKPQGLPVDRPRDGSLSLENHIMGLTFGFQRIPTAVHRLDRDTSGCLLLARHPKAHARFQQAFENGSVTKRYVAVIDGIPAEESGLIDMPLIKISSVEDGWRMTGEGADKAGGKASRTRWRVMATHEGRAFVAFYPETGRTHQIRVHAAEGLGFPITGDTHYGAAPGHKVMLHAAQLTVPRPGKPDVHAEAPLPQRFKDMGFGGGAAAPNGDG
ncbi:RluA family pseudouridine synthase [Sphingomonas sp. LT1P40]|uniref:RluA family pseudouridine synthase n=1 Tax=Alteristakelama amylovorans TaxID=3096166 RepID=UPI002FCA20FD